MARIKHLEGRDYSVHFTENEHLLIEREAETRDTTEEKCIEEYIVQRLDVLLHGFD